jgi:hypothetical protein
MLKFLRDYCRGNIIYCYEAEEVELIYIEEEYTIQNTRVSLT